MGGARLGLASLAALVAGLGAAVLAQHLFAPADAALRDGIALAVGLAAGAAVGLPSYLALRRRVRLLARASRAMQQADFDVPVPRPADDELGELERAWRRMRLSMEEQIVELGQEVGRQRSILDGMDEGVALLSDGEILAANPAFGQLIGAGGPLEGKTPLEAARLPELAEVIEESARKDTEVVREIVADPRTLRVTARPLGGREKRSVVVLLDMTEARKLERLRRDFVANASHELRTPVAAILGAVETLAAGAADDAEARASFVDILLRHSQRLSALTTDLLDLARMEAGHRAPPEVVPVAAVVDGVLATLQARADQKRLVVERQVEDGLALEGERAAVDQILTNLVENAVKYTPEGGRITVSAIRTGDRVELTVADTGQGISAEHLPRLFERFYRVDHARSRELGGTGLGLSIVKHLVAASGGEVRVESELGKGTRFVVLLPGADAVSKLSHGRNRPSP